MAKNAYLSSIIFCIAFGLCAHSVGQVGLASHATVKGKPIQTDPEPSTTAIDSVKVVLREKVLKIAHAEVGVVERTGNNDHPRILVYHRSVSEWLAKYRPIQPYCASGVNYCFKTAGVKVTGVPNPARARDWFLIKSRVVMTQQSLRGNRRMMKIPQKGDVVGYIFYGSAISHIELLEKIDLEEGYMWCVAFNTSSRGAATNVDRNGHGVYYVKRRINMFYKIAQII
jgi:hypothetical protein